MKIDRRPIFKIILDSLSSDPDFPLSSYERDLGIIGNSLVVRSKKVNLLKNYFKDKFDYPVDFPETNLDVYIDIHPETLPPELFYLYNDLLIAQLNPVTPKIYNKFIKTLKFFPYYSREDEDIIFFLLISGNTLPINYKEKLVSDLISIYPQFSDRVYSHKTLEDWVDSFKPLLLDLEFALKGLILIISESLEINCELEVDEENGYIYVNDNLFYQLKLLWDFNSLENLGYQQFIKPLSSIEIMS